MIHFGLTVLPGRKGLKIVREKYAEINKRSSTYIKNIEIRSDPKLFNPDDHIIRDGRKIKYFEDELRRFYTDEYCEEYQKDCLKNYDINMTFFQSLSKEKFDNEIERFKKKNKKFEEVYDLNEYESSGYYVMILDEYKQVYIGTTSNIKTRIRQHWSNTKSFDRLLFPVNAIETSKLSIDSFRALDTTRILAMKTNNIYTYEDNYINQFSPEFVANRLSGGIPDMNLISVLGNIKTR